MYLLRLRRPSRCESAPRAGFYEEVLRLPPPQVIDGTLEGDLGMLEYEIGPHTLAITTAWSGGNLPEHRAAVWWWRWMIFRAQRCRHLQAHDVSFGVGPIRGGPIVSSLSFSIQMAIESAFITQGRMISLLGTHLALIRLILKP